jgi:hypothetical protein
MKVVVVGLVMLASCTDAPVEPDDEVASDGTVSTGAVLLASSNVDSARTILRATFGWPGFDSCVRTPRGVCNLIGPCPVPEPTAPPPSGGVITATTDKGDIATNGYRTSEALITGAGEEVTITGSGGPHVDPFQTALVTPRVATLTAPALVDGAIEVSLTSDLHLAWTSESAGNLRFMILGQLECEFPASDHAAVIPASTLAEVEAVSVQNFYVDTVVATEQVDPRLTVEVMATFDGELPGGAAAYGPVRFVP